MDHLNNIFLSMQWLISGRKLRWSGKSELPTDERERFRKKDVAYSREITSVLTFGVVLFLQYFQLMAITILNV